MLGHAELALAQTSEPRVQQSLSEIFKASDRAKNLVKQILTFCRQRPPERQTQQLLDLVANVRENIPRLQRVKVNTLLIVDVHARDIIDSFVRDSILDAAAQCFAEQSYTATSMATVAVIMTGRKR